MEGTSGVEELFEIMVDNVYSDNLVKDLREDRYISELEIVSAESGRITGSVKTSRCTACRSFAVSKCFLVSVSSKPDGYVEWIVIGSHEAYRELLGSLEGQGVGVEVKRLSKAKGGKSLTARQEQILQIALEKGYFEYPKNIDLRSLASILDVSAPTLSELLRKAQKKILTEYFRGRVSTVSRQNRV